MQISGSIPYISHVHIYIYLPHMYPTCRISLSHPIAVMYPRIPITYPRYFLQCTSPLSLNSSVPRLSSLSLLPHFHLCSRSRLLSLPVLPTREWPDIHRHEESQHGTDDDECSEAARKDSAETRQNLSVIIVLVALSFM